MKTLIREYIQKEKRVLDMLCLDVCEKIIQVLCETYERGNQIFTFGNGGSGSTASHFACDINKGTTQGLKKKFKVICLNDNIPIMLAYANDNGYEDIFVEQLKNFLRPDDLVIGVSGSGNSPNVIKAIEYANQNRAISAAFTGFDGGYLAKISKIPIIVPINDMQKVEDIHLILTHIIMQILQKNLI